MDYQNFFFLVGLSGGPDSVMLLHYLLQKVGNRQLLATHCNFHLRGEESMRDQYFCEQLCEQLGVDLEIQDFDTYRYMEEQHVSLELAARQLRYSWWEQLSQRQEQQQPLPVRIAVGHHQDDSIETLLMNLMRGTGIQGLTGIPAQNGRIIRPLLSFTRVQVLQYLQEHQLNYVTDSTNLENEATRNKIRNLLLPLMEQINSNARQGIARTSQLLQETRLLAQERLMQLFSDTRHYEEAGVCWEEWTVPEDYIDPVHMETLFHYWSELHPSAQQHGRIFFTSIPDLSQQKRELSVEEIQPPFPPFSPAYELFDASQVKLPLIARHWQEGDRLQPLGMNGTKLVSDLFSNAHYSPNRKATTWIIEDASGRILSVQGLRVADWCKVTEQTLRVIQISNP